ncbi:hypothetical protein [Streptomyces sp. NPDC005181]|uniref:hypothetical protein n=1 Tax=Streptomyces sp. NPDC005181 TaxID=3156869 RepID=UPI0033B34244
MFAFALLQQAIALLPLPAPAGSATVRPAPLTPAHSTHLAPYDVITMHEGTPMAGAATLIEIAPPARTMRT